MRIKRAREHCLTFFNLFPCDTFRTKEGIQHLYMMLKDSNYAVDLQTGETKQFHMSVKVIKVEGTFVEE